MSEQEFLQALDESFQALTENSGDDAGGLVCVTIDHWHELRDRFGYRGLFELRGQVRDLLVSGLDESPPLFMPDQSTVVVLLGGADRGPLMPWGESLFETLNHQEFPLEDEVVAITATVTVCPMDLRFSDANTMLVATVRRAERLSSSGGHELAEVHPGLSAKEATADEKRMLALLMESLRTSSIRVVYQALLPASGDQVHSFQMLPRLKTDDGQLVAAADFLSIARSANLLGTIDRWMLTHAIEVASGPASDREMRLFINQSSELLADSKRRDWLASQLDHCADIRGKLVLDFQLTDAMANMKGTEALLSMARSFGVEVCFSRVDEHSNWNLLTGKLRCEYLRMAPTFVTRLAASEDLERDLDQLVGPVRKQGTRIIMPMIEDEGAVAHLWRSGVDFLQGNLIQAAEETLQFND